MLEEDIQQLMLQANIAAFLKNRDLIRQFFDLRKTHQISDEMIIKVFTNLRKVIFSDVSASNAGLQEEIAKFFKEVEAKSITQLSVYQRLMDVLNSMNNLLTNLDQKRTIPHSLIEGISFTIDRVFNNYIKKVRKSQSAA